MNRDKNFHISKITFPRKRRVFYNILPLDCKYHNSWNLWNFGETNARFVTNFSNY